MWLVEANCLNGGCVDSRNMLSCTEAVLRWLWQYCEGMEVEMGSRCCLLIWDYD